MRILMFNSNLSKNSGVMNVIMNYYRIINNNIQFDFLYFRDSENSYEKEIEQLGGECFKISSPKNIYIFKKELNHFCLEHENYNVVHIHDAIFAKLMYKTLKKNGVKNVIVHSHATKYSDKRISELRNYLICKNIVKYADQLFACSELAGKFLFKDKEFYIMKNAINPAKYQFSEEIREKMRKELKINNQLVIGHVGAFVNQKNHTFILNVFKEYLSKNSNSLLLLLGDGPLFDKIKQKSIDMGIYDNVIFLGKRNDVSSLYQVMDIFLLPSLYEGLPMVGVEAQCSGLPVIFSSEITKEVKIGKTSFINLSDPIEKWINQIVLLKNEINMFDRNSGTNDLRKCGFDILNESVKLIEKYKEIVRN